MVTGASSTKDFVNSMQSRDALSRNEANAASSAATELNTSMNRSERLDAIEKQIATLKTQADNKAAVLRAPRKPRKMSVMLWNSCARRAKPGAMN